METKETIIISLGGSMVVPDAIDTDFIGRFRNLIHEHIEQGKKFCLVIGGGKTARIYQQALQELDQDQYDDLDWMGIYATRLNAEMMRFAFGKSAHINIITDPLSLPETNAPILVASGWKPGWSTDYVAVTLAEQLGATTVINLSNIAYVYDSDPRTNTNAQKFDQLSWSQYRELIPAEWIPGMSAPFDPIASAKAAEQGISVAVIDGRNLENIHHYLSRENFKGTLIS